MQAPVVLKLGGELLEDAAAVRRTAAAVRSLAAAGPLVVVHGGGRAIDTDLRARGITPRFVDGLRITDAPTLDVVVAVLAGRNNTALVAALNAAGVRAVGLTGADAGVGAASRAPLFMSTSGVQVDLGLVGQPAGTHAPLLVDLLNLGYVPVVASIGVTGDGELLNVNADTLAGQLAGVLKAGRLIVAGGTAGVLDTSGALVEELTAEAVDAMIASGAAHSGMVAKLAACRVAVRAGVADVSIVSGRNVPGFDAVKGTRVVPEQPLEAISAANAGSQRP
ncbi:MAG: acetylglutamate kinase [Vicinamibacterales bacterium]